MEERRVNNGSNTAGYIIHVNLLLEYYLEY
jgi:hypothetical protein